MDRSISEIESLLAWEADISQFSQLRDRLRLHPRFPAAAQRLAANFLRDADEDPVLDEMLRDAGHNIAALSAAYLHASGGVTLPRLKALTARFGMVSPGRARALLGYMRHLGCIELDPDSADTRATPFRVTPRFLASYRRHEASLLDAIGVVEPAVGRLLGNLAAPGMMEALVVEQGDTFAAGNRQAAVFDAWYRAFLHPRAGIQILHGLVAQAETFPPAGDLPFSSVEVSRRHRVSRVHVGRLLKGAQDEGFLTLSAGALRFTEAGREAIAWQYASRICLHLACAARVLKAKPELLLDDPQSH